MPTVNYILGNKACAYVSSTAVTAATNTAFSTAIAGNPIGNITGTLTVDLSKGSQTINTRDNAANGWETNIPGLKKGTVKFNMIWRPGDANFAIIQTAFLGDGEIFFAALDQDKGTAGAQGIAGNFVVTDFSKGEPVDNAQTVDVTLAPSSFTGWYTKSGA